MTLILAALKPQFAFIAADGAEFRNSPGQPAQLEINNRRKLFPLPNRSIVLAVHGQDRIHTEDCRGGILIASKLAAFNNDLKKLPSVRSISEFLERSLTPDVHSTFAILKQDGVELNELKIVCIGFDERSDRSKAYEVRWRTPETGGDCVIVDYDEWPFQILHGGAGEDFAVSVLKARGGGKHLDTMVDEPLRTMPGYMKQLYVDAYKLQPPNAMVFGGEYHCVSVTAKSWKWQAVPACGFAPE